MVQIIDGTSNTFGVVEAGPPVPWTKPADFAYDPKKPLPKLEGPFANAFHVSMMDGAAFALKRDIDSKALRILIGMDDGIVSPDIQKLLARIPAETPEEKAALQDSIARNQELLEECNHLFKEHLELLKKNTSAAADITQAEEQTEMIRRLIVELKNMNKKLRSESGSVRPPPTSRTPEKR